MKDKEIEKILLNDEKYEKLVKSRIESEFKKAVSVEKKSKKTVTDFNKVPKSEIFSKNTVYIVLNKENKTKSYINGIQAEGFLGSDMFQRNKFLSKQADYFVCGNNYTMS